MALEDADRATAGGKFGRGGEAGHAGPDHRHIDVDCYWTTTRTKRTTLKVPATVLKP